MSRDELPPEPAPKSTPPSTGREWAGFIIVFIILVFVTVVTWLLFNRAT